MHRRLRNSLRLQLVLITTVLALVSAGSYALLTSWLAREQIEQDQFKLQRHLATRMSAQLAQDMAERGNELRFLSSMNVLRDPARAALDKQALLKSHQAVYPVYAWIGITNTEGRIVASTEPRLTGVDVSQRSWFVGGRAGLYHEDIHDAVLLGGLLPRPARDELPLRLIDIALPLRDEQGTLIGVLAAHLSLDWTYELRDQLLAELDGMALEMLLVNRAGEVILGSNSLPAKQTTLSDVSVVQRALAGQIATAIETWPDGRPYLSAAAPALGSHPYPGLGWAVVVRAAEDAALGGARRLAQGTLLTGLLAALFFSGLVWWLVGRQLRPLQQLGKVAAGIDVNGPTVALPEPVGESEAAVFTRSLLRLVNALRQSRERFQDLFERAPVAIAFFSLDGRLLNRNGRFLQLFGAGSERLTDFAQWVDHAFPAGPDRDQAHRRWARVRQMAIDSPVEVPGAEYAIRRGDGTERIVDANVIVLPDGILTAFHDLTERREAEASLRLWGEAFEHSEVGIVIVDATRNTIVAANPAFSRQRGYTPQELAGCPSGCLFPAERSADLGRLHQLLGSRDHAVMESEHIARDGHTFPVLIDVSVLRDAQDRPVRRVAYVLDLTEREQAAREIRRLNEELEQRVIERTAELSAANRELGSFAGAVSHDLRAPLRNINGFVQILQSDFADALGSEGLAHLQRIQSGTRRMSELIEGLLALSRHTNKPLARETVNLSALAQRHLAELAAAEPARRVVVDIEPDLLADCDAALAEALMVNLLDNAWKYSSKTPEARIRFHRGTVDGVQGFCVSDNGAGFDMAKAQRLFEPFERLHHASEFQGTGVGLATVRRIVDRHGGRIVAQAAPGQGASFCFTLRPEA